MQQQMSRRGSQLTDTVEAPPQLPLTDGRYFACRRCRRVLSESQWLTVGCVDCSAMMGVPDRDTLLDVATPHFHNFVGLIAPQQSWVARLIMKERAQVNGIFAEKLSDDETDEDEEAEDAVAERYDDDAGSETSAAGAFANPFDDVEEAHEAVPAPAVSSDLADEPDAVTPAHVADAPARDAEPRETKRVKLETDSYALRDGANA